MERLWFTREDGKSAADFKHFSLETVWPWPNWRNLHNNDETKTIRQLRMTAQQTWLQILTTYMDIVADKIILLILYPKIDPKEILSAISFSLHNIIYNKQNITTYWKKYMHKIFGLHLNKKSIIHLKEKKKQLREKSIITIDFPNRIHDTW